MKKYSMFFACLICTVMLVSCGGKKAIVAEDLAREINERAAFSEKLTELDENGAEHYFLLNPNDYEKMTAYVSTKAVCDEFVIIETSSPATVIDKLNAHLSKLKSEYGKYRPEQEKKTDNAFISEYNGTVVMIVSSDAALAEQIFNEYTKK